MHRTETSTKLPINLGIIHFIGIGGIGMSGIAKLLVNLGYKVTGSDVKESSIIIQLRALGISVWLGHEAGNIAEAAIVVISSAIKEDNIELKEARHRMIPVVKRFEMLAELMRLKSNVAVAGTHGKTTTTSMIAAVLEAGSLDPTVINGGIIQAYGSNARLGSGDWMVVEADESDGTLVNIPATVAVVTNLDPEHLEYYGNFQMLRKTFLEFISQVPFYGVGICCLDHPVVRQLVAMTRDKRILTYGFVKDADYVIKKLEYTKENAHFEIHNRFNNDLLKLELPMFGDHNISNAAAAVVVALHLNVSHGNIKKALKSFKGVKRRFTKICSWSGIDIIDDYAHHPVEIKAVLSAARQYSAGRVLVVHQPHRFTRLNSLMDDFVTCFDEADLVGITPVFSAGEKPIKGADANILISRINRHNDKAKIIENESGLLEFLCCNGKPGDIFLCLGAGSISQWANNLPSLLPPEA